MVKNTETIQCAAKLRVRHRADEKRRTNGSLGKKVIYNYIYICIYIYIYIYILAAGKANGPLGKKGERSPIFKLGWKCTGLRRALQVLMVKWWSFDQAAKINE